MSCIKRTGVPQEDITKEPIDFGKEGYISFTEETSPNFTGESMTLEEFMQEQSPQEGEVMKLC